MSVEPAGDPPLSVAGNVDAFRRGLVRFRAEAQELASLAQTFKALRTAHTEAIRDYDGIVEAETKAGLQQPGALRLTPDNQEAHRVVARAEFQVEDARERADKALGSLVTRYNRFVNQHLGVSAGPFLVSVMQVIEDDLGKKPILRTPTFERNGKSEHELAGEAIAANCAALLALLPEVPPEPVPARVRFSMLRYSGLVDRLQVDGYVERMGRGHSKSQLQQTIGAAKDLMEAVYRAAAELVGAQVVPDDYPKTSRNVREKLMETCLPARTTIKARTTLEQLLKDVGTLDYRLAEIRNEFGTGHGRATAPAGLRPYHADVAVDLAEMSSRLVVSLLREGKYLQKA